MIADGLLSSDHDAAHVDRCPDAWTPPDTGARVVTGTSASPGLVIAPVFQYRSELVAVEDIGGNPEVERALFDQVLERADAELQRMSDDAEACPLPVQAEIFDVHRALLCDPDMLLEVRGLIENGHAASWSWQQVIESRVARLRRARNRRLAARATDLLDIGQRVLRLFAGAVRHPFELPPGEWILVADDLTPSDTAHINPKNVVGLCTSSGGPTSHTAILARARGLPTVVAAKETVLALPQGTLAVLDGSAGRMYPEPGDELLASAREFRAARARKQARADAERFRPAVLTDGHRVEIAANIGEASEAATAIEAGAEGVGLLRTEFMFLCRETAPTEEEQFLVYCEVIAALGGLPLIIRTFDIGGDKVAPYLDLAPEVNPFLGVRGIRLSLRRPDVFRIQLRALYRAAATAKPGTVKIMFPMIATLEDLRSAKAAAEEVRAEVGAPACEFGIMVEVPSAVLMARELAREVAFLSIGTNDLTQYALAIDREHPELGREADSLHPAVLRLIDQTVRAAQSEGKWVGVCGGAASDPIGAMLLTGLGVSELSISIPSLATVKACLRGYSSTELKTLARRALGCSTATEVRALSK